MFQVNYDRIRNKVSMCRAVKSFDEVYMVKKIKIDDIEEAKEDQEMSDEEEEIILNRDRKCKPTNLHEKD